jgi:hypothetical protein
MIQKLKQMENLHEPDMNEGMSLLQIEEFTFSISRCVRSPLGLVTEIYLGTVFNE